MTKEIIKKTVLVILYKSNILESIAINFLFNKNTYNSELKIIIWNVGENISMGDFEGFIVKCRLKNIHYEIYENRYNSFFTDILPCSIIDCAFELDKCDFFSEPIKKFSFIKSYSVNEQSAILNTPNTIKLEMGNIYY